MPQSMTREERLKLAGESSFARQCEKQWALLWPLAREGDGEALMRLAGELYNGGLELPDSDWETSRWQKQFANALAVAIYGATAPVNPRQDNLRIILDSLKGRRGAVAVSMASGSISYRALTPPSIASIDELQRCFGWESRDRCVSQATELGLIPSFPEYRKAVDEILAKNRPKSCYFNAL